MTIARPDPPVRRTRLDGPIDVTACGLPAHAVTLEPEVIEMITATARRRQRRNLTRLADVAVMTTLFAAIVLTVASIVS